MSYRLVYKKRAIQHLADVWNKSSDRNAVTEVIAWIESRLMRDPLSLGESRDASVNRVYIRSPMGIEFVVIEDDKKVIVRAIWSVP